MSGWVLDSGGVTFLAAHPLEVRELRRAGASAPLVPTAVLVECLTGDHRRDHATNRLLRTCRVVELDEATARRAASLRRRAGAGPSAVDAVVVALADARGATSVISSDTEDLSALAAYARTQLRIVGV